MLTPSWLRWLRSCLLRNSRRSRRSRQSHGGLWLEMLEDRTVPSTFWVTNTDDNPGEAGTLRQAIIDADNNPGLDTIKFGIPASDSGHLYYTNVSTGQTAFSGATDDTSAANPGMDPTWPNSWWRIQPQSALPYITDPVIIDGYTQAPDAALAAKRNDSGSGQPIDAVLRIELDGSLIPSDDLGLLLQGPGSGGSTICGLVINNCPTGIEVAGSSGDTFQGNFIGTDPSGSVAEGNGAAGIYLTGGCSNSIIGTDDRQADATVEEGERNLISANFGAGVRLGLLNTNNVIAGNFIGVDRTGQVDLGNYGAAINISGQGDTGNRIGIDLAGVPDDIDRNIIAGSMNSGASRGYGIIISFNNPNNNMVAGNYIGTDVTGTQAISNESDGVLLAQGASYNVVERNVIAGNGVAGVGIALGANHNLVFANDIGVAADGISPLGNFGPGVALGVGGASNNQIGGPGLQTNTIAFNHGPGVWLPLQYVSGGVTHTDTTSTGNAIRGNSIYANDDPSGGLGIDLGGTFNLDTFSSSWDNAALQNGALGHSGPNNLQNYPQLTSATTSPSGTTITGTLDPSLAGAVFDFYANTSADPTGYGEGETYLGSYAVTDDDIASMSFTAQLSAVVPPGLGFLTATATGPDDSTSEFGPDLTGVISLTSLASSSSTSIAGQQVTFTATVAANAGSATPGGAVTFYDSGTALGTPVPLTGGSASLTVATLPVGSHDITAAYSGDGTFFASTSATLTQTVNDVTAANLLQVLTANGTVTVEANNDPDAQNLLAAVNGLPPNQTPTATLNLSLSGKVGSVTVNAPANLTLTINGTPIPPGTTVDPAVPAFTVNSGNVVVSGVTFRESGDAPTIVVTGGTLTLRNDVIEESTGFTQAAIAITGGTVDLGTADDPGGNTLNINGTGEFIQNSTANAVPTVGDTFQIDGTTVTNSWTGAEQDGNWDTPGNWSTGMVPTQTDLVNIDAPTATITVDAAFAYAYSLTDNAALVISGGSLSLTAASTVDNTLTLSGGTLTGGGILTVQAGIRLAGGALDDFTLTNPAGQTAGLTGDLYLNHGAVFDNEGTLDNQADVTISGDATARFENNGSFTKSAGSASSGTVIGVTFNSAGPVDLEQGNLYLTGGATSSGGITAVSGTELWFSGPYSFTVDGNCNVNYVNCFPGAQVTFAGHYSAAATDVYRSTVTFTGEVDSLGAVSILSATLDVTQATFGPNGTTLAGIYNAGSLRGAANWTVTGAFDCYGGEFHAAGGQGSILAEGGAAPPGLNWLGSNVPSDGTVLAGLALDGYSMTIPAGQTVPLTGGIGLTNGAVFDNEGTLDNQTDVTISGDAASHIENNGSFTKSAGNASSGTVIGVTFNSAGPVDLEQGNLYLTGGATSSGGITAASGTELWFSGPYSFTVDGNCNVSYVNCFPGAQVTFAGHYSAAATDVYRSTVTCTGEVDSLGAVSILSATLDVTQATFGPNGTTLAGIYNAGSLRGAANWTVTGAFDCYGGEFHAAGGQGSILAEGGAAPPGLNWLGSNVPSDGTILAGLALDGYTFINTGATTWSSGNVAVQNGGAIQNAAGATFGSSGNTNSVFLNGGTLAGSGTVNANVSNNGQVALTTGGGSLILNGNYVQGPSGTLGIGLAGTAAGTGYGQLVVNGGVTLNGSFAGSISFLSAVGDQFAILHDAGSAGISGTFAGLPEGSVVLVNGQRFQISYVGGAGHDVVLTHRNTPPTLANVSVTSPINEGSTATVTGTIVDPDPLDTHTLVVKWGDGSAAQTFTFGAGALSLSLAHRYLDNPPGQPSGSFPIALQVTDSNGGQGTASTAIQVNGVAPTATLSGPSLGVPGQPRTFTFSATSPSPTDQAAGFTYAVSWGDGTPLQTIPATAGNGAGVAVDHIYTAPGQYTVTVTATDDDSTDPPASQTIRVRRAQMESNSLAVGGRPGNDTITLTPADTTGDINVNVNGRSLGNFKPADHILVYSQTGNDTITLASTKIKGSTYYITVPAFLYGGGLGKDTDVLDASGSTANNVLVGGAGKNNTLQGGKGQDLLIAGLGMSTLNAGSTGDILIGGWTTYTDLTGTATTYDQKLTALEAIMAEWGPANSYATRVNALSSGGGLNGNYVLNASTVHDNVQADTLAGINGAAPLDWFFASATDNPKHKNRGEVVTTIS
jgi:hypothetical protein